MGLGASWEAATQEFPNICGTRKFITVLTRAPPPSLIPILSQINPDLTTLSYFFKVHCNLSNLLRLGFSSRLFPSGLSTSILYAFPV
jgi:hypothetical protein